MVRLAGVVLLMILLFQGTCLSQDIRATTEDGRNVVLKKDGTYSFVEPSKTPVSTGKQLSYVKPAKSTAVFRPKGDKFLVWYDPSLWQEKKDGKSDKPSFRHKDGDIGAMVLAERIQIPLSTLKDLAIDNAREAAPDARVVSQENRVVNGRTVLCMKIQGTIQGIGFVYLGYYYAGQGGLIQHLTYAPLNLFSEYEKDMTDFLNGLVIND